MADASPSSDAGLPSWMTGGIDIGSLVKQAQAGPDTSPITKSIGALEKSRKEEKAKLGSMMSDRDKQEAADKKRAEQAAGKSQEAADAIPEKWTQKPPENDPIKAWGQPAMILGVLAAAFTKQPMLNALNASAAAMNSARQNNLQNYNEAFKAWKENTQLAMDRYHLMHDAYQDAIGMWDKNATLSDAKIRQVAAMYGDDQALVLHEAGLSKEMIGLQQERFRNLMDMESKMPEMIQLGLTQQTYLAKMKEYADKGIKPSPAQITDAYRQAKTQVDGISSYGGIAQDVYFRSLADGDTPVEAAKKAQVAGGKSGGTMNPLTAAKWEAYQKDMSEFKAKNGREPTAAEQSDMINRATKGGITGNELEKLQQRDSMIDISTKKIDGALDSLQRHFAEAGIGGDITRAAERVGNIFGSNQTDREQFMRDIELLHLQATQLLTMQTGRPLGAQASIIDSIIGGISLGDTTANTYRSLQELRDIYSEIRADNEAQMVGTYTPHSQRSNEAASPTTKPTDDPWSHDQMVR